MTGVIGGLVGLAFLAGGGLLVGFHETKRDGDGFYTSYAKQLATPTYALTSDTLDVGTEGPGWLFRRDRLGSVRVATKGTGNHPMFIGVGPTREVAAYLKSVAHDQVSDLDGDRPVTYERHAGASAPQRPATQQFWAVSTAGTEAQVVKWPVTKGSWTVVVMNADGSRGVRTTATIGADIPLVFGIGIGLLAVGVLIGSGAGVALYFSRRRPRRSSSESPVASRLPRGTEG